MKSDFVNKWKHKLAGLALFGVTSDRNDGPTVRSSKVFDIPQMVETLLGELYDSAQPEPTVDELTEMLLARYGKLPVDDQKKMVERLRVAFTKETNGKK